MKSAPPVQQAPPGVPLLRVPPLGRKPILVRATNWIGDVVMTLPALEALRERYPENRLVVLARPWVREILASHPAVDGVIDLARGRGRVRDLAELWLAVGRVRRSGFGMAVLFQNAFEAALITRLAGVPVRVGYDTDGRRLLLTHPLPRKSAPRGVHQTNHYLSLVRALGWRGEPGEPSLHAAAEEREAAALLLEREGVRPGRRIVGLAPGAAFGPAKRWPPERFAAAADRAAGAWDADVVILGSAGDRESCRAVASAMHRRPLDFCGRTGLGRAVALIASCDLFLTNDSGLMHVASALDVPTVAVFGSTDAAATGPMGSRSRVVRNPVSCAPCLRKVCPEDYRCLTGVSVDDVWREMSGLMEDAV
jgi:heptosyltransferase II